MEEILVNAQELAEALAERIKRTRAYIENRPSPVHKMSPEQSRLYSRATGKLQGLEAAFSTLLWVAYESSDYDFGYFDQIEKDMIGD